MRKFFSSMLMLLLGCCTYSQQLSQVTFSGGSKLSYISFITDQNVLIRISEEGKILEWGIEVRADRYNYYAPKLQPYIGRIDYYGPEADSAFRGKVRSIGTCSFTYYGSYETEIKIGKIKSVGRTLLDYYTNYDNIHFRGRLKFIGSLMLGYYSSFDDEAFRGKLKAIGSTVITYYSTFDDKLIRGKIKSIATVPYVWYTSVDKLGYGGSLKSGSLRQNISGVTYILQ